MLERRDRSGDRSPFAAAFLSFLFPGLGQAYAGLPLRALGFALLPVLGLALLAGAIASDQTRTTLIASLTSPTVLLVALGLNVALLFYRAVAVLDAYRAAAYVRETALHGNRLGPPRRRLRVLPLTGVAVLLAVTSAGHVAAARYNLLAYDLVTSIGAPTAGRTPRPTTAGPTRPGASPQSVAATPLPTSTPPPAWNGRELLNILLIGTDSRPALQGEYHTDTLILASIDPVSRQVAMLSLPRDTVNVPLPEAWPAASFYAGGTYPGKINSLWTTAIDSPNLFPGSDDERGYIALKGALGELYQLDIRYYMEVDFSGFRSVIDTLGGVMIDVQVPVTDDHYPSDDGRGALNLYIPAGIQHMNGAEALAYARARHSTSDFDRAERQQRVILSLREQTDIGSLLAPGRLDAVAGALKQAVRTDIPAELFPQLVALGQDVDFENIRKLVFTPPLYQTECVTCYSLTPNVETIREAVREAFAVDPEERATRERLAAEGAEIWVVNGSGAEGQASRLTTYLASHGLAAQVPNANGGRADRLNYEETEIRVYNGASARLPRTLRLLRETLGVRPERLQDEGINVDIVVITGSETPDLTPAPELTGPPG